jgi:hypothetical protein
MSGVAQPRHHVAAHSPEADHSNFQSFSSTLP